MQKPYILPLDIGVIFRFYILFIGIIHVHFHVLFLKHIKIVIHIEITHLFNREMGISFYRCVIQRHLAEGKNLIVRGISMEEVSLGVGFQEYSAFYRAFKAEYGISPMQYRKILQESQ